MVDLEEGDDRSVSLVVDSGNDLGSILESEHVETVGGKSMTLKVLDVHVLDLLSLGIEHKDLVHLVSSSLGVHEESGSREPLFRASALPHAMNTSPLSSSYLASSHASTPSTT